MQINRLNSRFLLAGCLLAAITVGVGLWSAWTFASLSAVVDRALRDNRESIDLTTLVEGSLEREDDALLLALGSDPEQAAPVLEAERRRGDEAMDRLREQGERGSAVDRPGIAELGRAIAAYRRAVSRLIEGADDPGALMRYHEEVNPLLRRAVLTSDRIRERNFASIRRAGVVARDEARLAIGVVLGASAGALLLAAGVAWWLARSVIPPIHALTDSVEAIRRGDFDHRVRLRSADEFGRLAEGFNRMAETLAEYRRSSLGELLAAKATLEATLDALPDAVFVIAPDGHFAAMNPPARAILDAEHVAGARHLRELPIAPLHREAIDSALAGQAVTPSRVDFDRVLRVRVGGGDRKLMLSAIPVRGFELNRTGAVVVLDDVTEIALLDELRGELIAVASHELKSPLTSLRMNLMLLAESAGAMPPLHRDMLDNALDACEDFAATIDELLDVTRIEAGQLRLDLGPVDLSGVLDVAIRGLRHRFEDAEVRLDVRWEAPAAVVLGDSSRLRMVLTNLLSNALKYSPRGGVVTVRIDADPGDEVRGSGTIRVSVEDDGPGIPEGFRDRVFEKFFRVENQRDGGAKGTPGTGIGLYLCREIIQAHGGSIRCEPAEDGAGARLLFSLQAVAAPDHAEPDRES